MRRREDWYCIETICAEIILVLFVSLSCISVAFTFGGRHCGSCKDIKKGCMIDKIRASEAIVHFI